MITNKCKEQLSELIPVKKKARTNIATTYPTRPEVSIRKEPVLLYALPNELFLKCLSFVGKGYYGLVGPASKKLNESYKEEFGSKTAYLAMATSVELANHCIDKYPKEKDKLLKAAAVNGNVDILRNAVSRGYDLSPLVKMEKTKIYIVDDKYFDDYEDVGDYFGEAEVDEDDVEHYAVDFYYTDEDAIHEHSGGVKLSQLVARGHLHVLKYLHEELNYHKELSRYVKPAIQYGELDILKWLNDIGCMDEENDLLKYEYDPDVLEDNYKLFYFDDYAIKYGNVQSLEWLSENGFDVNPPLVDVIRFNSLEMIRYVFDKGYYGHDYDYEYEYDRIRDAIIESGNIQIYRLLHELGFEFKGTMKEWISCKYTISEWIGEDCVNFFDIIKFLRSISIRWDDRAMPYIAKYGTLEMIIYARNDGCPWTNLGHEYKGLFDSGYTTTRDGDIHINCQDVVKLQYLISNECIFDHKRLSKQSKLNLIEALRSKKDIALLDFFIGKNSSFDNMLLWYFVDHSRGEFWFDGINYVKENGKDVQNFFQPFAEV